MNIGFCIDSLAESEENHEIFDFLHKAVSDGTARDASVFYKDIAYNSANVKVGLFNSSDLWMFTGSLLVTTVEAAYYSSKIVNKFKKAFLYDGKEKNILGLIDIFNIMPCIVRNKEDYNYIKRVTGKQPVLMEELNINTIRKTVI